MKPIPYDQNDTVDIMLKNDESGEIYEGKYVDMRLQMDTISTEKFAYNCRHGDDGNCFNPITIEKGNVRVNFAGVFITDKEIVFPEGKDYIPVRLID